MRAAMVALLAVAGCAHPVVPRAVPQASAEAPSPATTGSVPGPATIAAPPSLATTASPPADIATTSPQAPAQVGLDRDIACTFETRSWKSEETFTELALRPGGRPFVRIGGAQGRVSIPVGPADDALLLARDEGYRVQGHVAVKAVPLRPREPFVLDGFAIPTMFARLGWSSAESGAIEVTHEVSRELQVPGLNLSGRRPCSDVGLESNEFDAALAVPQRSETARRDARSLPGGQTIAISTAPGSGPVGRLTPDKSIFVDVHESRDDMSRISFELNTLVIFGWVKTSQLGPTIAEEGYGRITGRLPPRPLSFDVKERWVCHDVDVPLLAKRGADRLVVGLVEKGSVIEAVDRFADEVAIRLWTKQIRASSAAVILVRVSDLTGCERLDRPRP